MQHEVRPTAVPEIGVVRPSFWRSRGNSMGEQPAKNKKPIKAGSAQHAEKRLFVVHLF
jgi:hypothetical protein